MIEVGKFYVLKEGIVMRTLDPSLSIHSYPVPIICHIKKIQSIDNDVRIDFTYPFQKFTKIYRKSIKSDLCWIYLSALEILLDRRGYKKFEWNEIEDVFLFELDEVYYKNYKEFYQHDGKFSRLNMDDDRAIYSKELVNMTYEHISYLYDIKLYDKEVKSL